ncbi:MAG TPA: hypothetical protein VLI67_05310 [Vicinamibacteria bacterium]|nr:hypothetical protein [Vicinamibacteria bacterium]
MAVEGGAAGPSGPHPRLAALGRGVAEVRARVWSAYRGLSPRGRLAASAGLGAAFLLVVYGLFSIRSATLKVVCRHGFRTAEITVSVDGDVVHRETLAGAVKKMFGVLERTEGSYTRNIPVSSGEHVVEVRLRAPGYDHTRSIEGLFRRGRESVLSVDSARDLTLAWRAAGSGVARAGPAEETRESSAWPRYAGSILLTMCGSVISAVIGFLVQESLRNRKARLAEAKPAERESSKIAS